MSKSRRATALSSGALVIAAVLFAAPAPVTLDAAPQRDVDTVLAKAAHYLADYEKAFSVVVAEESYIQTVVTRVGRNTQRTLRSDVLQTSVGQEDWVAFRDVFEVNGQKVRDRDTRLQKLFLDAPAEAVAQSRRIVDESARYNIGSLRRNINVPTMGLTYLRSVNQSRSAFTEAGRQKIDDVDAVVLTFVEKARPTIVRSGTKSLPATGRFWIDPESGRVLKTEVAIAGAGSPAKITVTYGPVPKMAIWAPVHMKEEYDGAEMIRAEASYSNFRQFTVAVDSITSAEGTGIVCGTVTAPSGAPKPDVAVTLTGRAASPLSTTADRDGDYLFTNVQPGTYSVTFAIAGYKKSVRNGLLIAADREYRADMRMEVSGPEVNVDPQSASVAYDKPKPTVETKMTTSVSAPPRPCKVPK